MHDELIHTVDLIMTVTTGIGLRAYVKLNSMYIAVRMCESINLTLECTVKIVPHLTSSWKIGNLSTDLKSDYLEDDHLGHRVIGCPLL